MLKVGAGYPFPVTWKVPLAPTTNVVLPALVIDGACCGIRIVSVAEVVGTRLPSRS